MSKENFQKLITQYCELIGLKDSKPVLAGQPILIDDIPVSILYSEKQRPNSLIIYSELGKLPEKNKHKTERKLLEANATMYLTSGSCFTRLHYQGPIIHSSIVSLEGMSAKSLCDLVESLVKNAQQWKVEFFQKIA